MFLLLELVPTADGRVEGSVRSAPSDEPLAFSGWLELLRLLEAAITSPAPPGGQT